MLEQIIKLLLFICIIHPTNTRQLISPQLSNAIKLLSDMHAEQEVRERVAAIAQVMSRATEERLSEDVLMVEPQQQRQPTAHVVLLDDRRKRFGDYCGCNHGCNYASPMACARCCTQILR
jgi:hypothetical protein